MILEIIVWLFLLIYIIFIASWILPALIGTAPYYPSNRRVVKQMVKLAKIKKKDNVVDLGSGDGRILFEASKYSDNVTGVEMNPFWVFLTRLRVMFRRSSIKVTNKNFYKLDLSKYDVIFCYLLPHEMQKLAKKFENELRPGTKVITNTFTIKDKKPEVKEEKIYVYTY